MIFSQHEMFVRSVAMDRHRVVTGDVGGYVFVWSLPNCMNSAMGPDALCLRAHNAIDSDRPMRDTTRLKNIYLYPHRINFSPSGL